MPTQKDLIVGTTLKHLRHLQEGPPKKTQNFVKPVPLARAIALASSAMRTAAKFQACLRVNTCAKTLVKQLLSWYAFDGHRLILQWQTEIKSDAGMVRQDDLASGRDELLLDRGRARPQHFKGFIPTSAARTTPFPIALCCVLVRVACACNP